MLIFSLAVLLLSVVTTQESQIPNATTSRNATCPLWTLWNPRTNSCQCGDDLKGVIVYCSKYDGVTRLKKCYCMTTDDRNPETPVVGECLYSCFDDNSLYQFYTDTKYRTVHNTTAATCERHNRRGVMCGKCAENYGMPVYFSYSIDCVKCTDYKYNWLKYLAVAYIPMTVFYFVVIVFRLSATSGALLGYVVVCQALSSPLIARMWSSKGWSSVGDPYITLLITVFSFWNLDFYRHRFKFCLHPELSALQVVSLDYLTALYPMVLTFLLYLFIKLHDRFRFLIWICRPVYRCLHFFRREWEIKTSLVGTFSTFYLLSYVKILNISGNILAPIHLFYMNGSHHDYFWYYDASIPYFGKEHYPYAVLALTLMLLLNVCPMLLLCLYPVRSLHKCLNKTRCSCHILHVFMDAILGAYRHRPHERRYFGALYLLMRILHVFGMAILNPLLYCSYASLIVMFVIVSIAYFRPYKNNWHNVTDIVLFSALLYATLMGSFLMQAVFVSPLDTYTAIGKIYLCSFFVIISIIFFYGVGLFLFKVLPLSLIKRVLNHLSKWICCRCLIIKRGLVQLEETLPYRMEYSETETDPLLEPK